MQWNKIILMKEKKFLFCYNFVHLYRSLDLPISIMYFGFLSVRVCAAANQVAVNKTTQFGDPDIAAHRSAHFSPQSLLLSLLSRRLAEGWTEKLMKSLGLHVNSLPVQRKTIRTWRLMMKGLCIITAGYIHLFPSLIGSAAPYYCTESFYNKNRQAGPSHTHRLESASMGLWELQAWVLSRQGSPVSNTPPVVGCWLDTGLPRQYSCL